MEIKDRISLIIKENRLTSQQFGEMIDIQPSSLSHISAGRNQPSLKVIMNILDKFPDISSDWLISGKGNMYRADNVDDEYEVDDEVIVVPKVEHEVINDKNTPIFTDVMDKEEKSARNTHFEPIVDPNSHFATTTPSKEEELLNEPKHAGGIPKQLLQTDNKITKMIVFYEDNTFEVFTSR